MMIHYKTDKCINGRNTYEANSIEQTKAERHLSRSNLKFEFNKIINNCAKEIICNESSSIIVEEDAQIFFIGMNNENPTSCP